MQCEDCNISTKPKESSSSEKNKQSSDKDRNGSTSQGNHKHHLSPCPSSLDHDKKEAHINSSTCSLGESSCARLPSWSGSMSDYGDHSYFVEPRNASTLHKLGHQMHNHSSSTESRCSQTPLDCSLYNNFYYRGHMGFGGGGVTPESIAGLQQCVATWGAVFPRSTTSSLFLDS